MDSMLIFGASGHAKVVIDIVERQADNKVAFLIDDNSALKGQSFFGYIVRGAKDDLLSMAERPTRAIVAIGDNEIRASAAFWLESQGFELGIAIHPSAQIGRDVTLGPGSVVMANAVINPGTKVGKNTIVNTGASIDHDCVIGESVHIAPGATLCGGIRVGDESFICAGATIIPNIVIGAKCIIGAGATVIGDLPVGVVAVGNPARIK